MTQHHIPKRDEGTKWPKTDLPIFENQICYTQSFNQQFFGRSDSQFATTRWLTVQRRSSIGPSKSGGALKELGDLRSGIFLEINEILAGALLGLNDFFQEKKQKSFLSFLFSFKTSPFAMSSSIQAFIRDRPMLMLTFVVLSLIVLAFLMFWLTNYSAIGCLCIKVRRFSSLDAKCTLVLVQVQEEGRQCAVGRRCGCRHAHRRGRRHRRGSSRARARPLLLALLVVPSFPSEDLRKGGGPATQVQAHLQFV